MVPRLSSWLDTIAWKPWTIDTTAITAATPITIPSVVSTERIALVQIAPSAMRRFSRNMLCIAMISVKPKSRLWAGLVARRVTHSARPNDAGRQHRARHQSRSIMAREREWFVSCCVLVGLASTPGAPAQELSVGFEFQVNTFTADYQGVTDVGADADGDFVVVWQSNTQDDSNYGLFARRFSSAGAPLGGEFQVNTSSPSSSS